MPSKHPRIALTRDPELDAALEATAPILASRSTAGLARELILRGARAVLDGPGSDVDRRLDALGASRPTRSVAELVATARAMGPFDPDDPRPLSDALEELRADRI